MFKGCEDVWKGEDKKTGQTKMKQKKTKYGKNKFWLVHLPKSLTKRAVFENVFCGFLCTQLDAQFYLQFSIFCLQFSLETHTLQKTGILTLFPQNCSFDVLINSIDQRVMKYFSAATFGKKAKLQMS